MATDKAAQVFERWNERMRERLRPLITDELIAEHRRTPLGQHSDALDRVLNYFRRMPLRGKYIAVWTEPHKRWRIATLAGIRGKSPQFISEPQSGTEAQALHAVFMHRVEDLKRR